jgi:hypothetical protein
MGLITTPVPNLIQGVSQQPPTVRLPDQAQGQVNAFPWVSEGLGKRPPAEFVGELGAAYVDFKANNEPKVHIIDQGDGEQFAVVLYADSGSTSNLKVFDLSDGSEISVAFPDGKTYLTPVAGTDNRDAFELVTTEELTFVLSRLQTAPSGNVLVTDFRNPEGLIFMTQALPSQTYTVIVEAGGVQAEFTATSGATPSTNGVIGNLYSALTHATSGLNGSSPPLPAPYNTGWTVKHLQNAGGTNRGNVIVIARTSDTNDFNLDIGDPGGNTGLKAAKEHVDSLSDLPKIGPVSFKIKISGDSETSSDDLYVKFVTSSTQSPADLDITEGVWEETRIDHSGAGTPTEGFRWAYDKMPHVLTGGSGGFTFAEANGSSTTYQWLDKEVGDSLSNPFPEVGGNKIQDIFIYKSRLGLVAGDKVTLSEFNNFFNLFRTTVTTLLDTSPINIKADQDSVKAIKAGVPFREQLVLFSDQKTQMVLESAGDVLAPRTASTTLVTQYQVRENVRPITSGKSLYFATDLGGFSGIREYVAFSVNQAVEDALDLTSQVPRYIAGAVLHIAANTNGNTLVVQTDDDPNVLYVYNYYWDSDKKLQNAWSKWEMPAEGEILHVEFLNNELYILADYGDQNYLEKVNIEPLRVDDDAPYLTLLDRRVDDTQLVSAVYSAGPDTTALTLPYEPSSSAEVWTRWTGVASGGEPLIVTDVTGAVVTVQGDHSSTDLWVGEPYEKRYEFSPLHVRQPSQRGGIETRVDGRYQVLRGKITFQSSVYFRVDVTPKFGTTRSKIFDAKTIGQYVIGTLDPVDGVFEFAVGGRGEDTVIEIVNDRPFPDHIVAAEFTGTFTPKTQFRT